MDTARKVTILRWSVALLVAGLTACAPVATELPPASVEVETADTKENQDSPSHEVAETFETAWPTVFTRAELTSSALARTFDYFDNGLAAPQKSVVVEFEDSISDKYREPVEDIATAMVARFAVIAQDEHYVFVGTSIPWLIARTNEMGLPLPENGNGIDQPKMPFEEWGPGAYPEGFASGWAHRNLAWVGVSNSWNEAEARYVAGHEVFHSLHLSIDGGNQFEVYPDEDPRNRPRWLIEGGANFFSYSALDHLGLRDYTSPRLAAGIWSLKEFESWWSSEAAYDYGQKAVEYLVANVGVDRVLGIYAGMGEGKEFAQAFQDSIGISVEDFYLIFDAHVAGI